MAEGDREKEKVSAIETTETTAKIEHPREQQAEVDVEQVERRRKEEIGDVRSQIKTQLDLDAAKQRGLAEEYIEKSKKLEDLREKGIVRKMFSAVAEKVIKLLYRKFPQVKEGNNPQSENYYLRKVERFNQEQESRAEKKGFKKKIAFLGHIHSRGAERWADGSDGSLSPEEIVGEYQKAARQLKEHGYDEVFVAITDHNAINNSIRLAELLAQEGVVKPIVGIEAATREGYEVLGYTTDVESLKEFYRFQEPALGKIFRFAKSKNKGVEIIKKMRALKFVMGLPHPTANKAIIFGGTFIERFERDPGLARLMSDNMLFYEGMNWFQNVQGSNCLAFGMREQMLEMGVLPFANEDFHSKVRGSGDTFFNGMYTEILTEQEIRTGEDLLALFRTQKTSREETFISALRGLPATATQYKEHLNNASGRTIRCILKSIFGIKK